MKTLAKHFEVRHGRRMHPMKARCGMLARLTMRAGLVAVGLALMAGQGCKKQAPAPVQPAVRTAPRVALPDFPDEPPPVPVVADRAEHHSARRPVAVPVVREPRPVVDQAALAEAQRQRDASLLQRQQAASQRQQQELNGVVRQSLKIQQDQQSEPRIQDAPEVPITQPNGLGPRIQDNPNVPAPQQSEPEQPSPQESNPAPAQGNPGQQQPPQS